LITPTVGIVLMMTIPGRLIARRWIVPNAAVLIASHHRPHQHGRRV
jgi:hypothetical protein